MVSCGHTIGWLLSSGEGEEEDMEVASAFVCEYAVDGRWTRLDENENENEAIWEKARVNSAATLKTRSRERRDGFVY